MDQKRLKATENYVYCVMDDLIGKGATCEVYRGIHKVLLICFPPFILPFQNRPKFQMSFSKNDALCISK